MTRPGAGFFVSEGNKPMSDETQGGQTQTPPTDPAPAPAEVKPEPAEAKPAEKPEEVKPVVPEKYEFKPPEGVEFDSALLDEYTPVFKESGLTQDAAQKLLETHLTIQQAAHTKQLQTWEGELKADKDFGGKNFEANTQAAQKAVARFLTAEDKAYLDRTGLGSYPGLVKAFLRIGKAISEDSVPQTPQQPAARGPKDIYNHPTSAALA